MYSIRVCVSIFISCLVLQPTTTTTTTTAGGEPATPPPPPGEGVTGGGGGSRSKSSKRRKSTGKRRSRRFGRRSSVALINFSDGSPATTAKVRHTHTNTLTHAHIMYSTHSRSPFTIDIIRSAYIHNLCHDTHFTHTNMHTHTHTHTLFPSLSLSVIPQVNPPLSPTTHHSVFSPAQPNTSSNTAPNSGEVPIGNLLSFTTQQGEPIIVSDTIFSHVWVVLQCFCE